MSQGKRGHIRARSKGTWQVTVELPRDPGTGARRQHVETIKGTQKDALRRLTELQRQADQGLPMPRGGFTLAAWLDRWLEDDVRPTHRQKSHERYEGIARRHIIPHLGALPLPRVQPHHVKALLVRLAEGGMAPAGVDLVRNVLHSAMKAALQGDLVARNPVQAVPAPKVRRKEIAPPTASQIAAVLGLAEADGHPLFAALHLLAYTGARRGEVLTLRWKDVNLLAGTIAITRSLGRTLVGLQVEEPKTAAGRRVVDMDARTVAVLQAHQGRQVLEKMAAEGAYQDQGLVFADALGGPVNPMQLTRAFQRYTVRAGLGRLKLHALRHAHASILFAGGADVFAVSRRLGHASITTTADVYGHLLPGAGKAHADAFARAMEQARGG